MENKTLAFGAKQLLASFLRSCSNAWEEKKAEEKKACER